MPTIPANFNGEKFRAKYNLGFFDFYDDGTGNLVCPLFPNLTEADLADCVTKPEEFAEMQDQDAAIANLITQYIWARDRLDEIINTPDPTVANLATLTIMARAIKDEARVLRGILKFIKRRFPA